MRRVRGRKIVITRKEKKSRKIRAQTQYYVIHTNTINRGKIALLLTQDGGRISMVRASGFKPEHPEFNPLVGKDDWLFFYPSESTCAALLVPSGCG